MRKFKVGDRIEVLQDLWRHVGLYSAIRCARKGEKGTIVEIQEYEGCNFLGVKFDNYNPHRHDCMGFAKEGHGCYINNPIEAGFIGYNIPKLHEPIR